MEQFEADKKQNYPLEFPDTNFDVIAFAASAGGLKALSAVISQLPANFSAAILVVQHLDRNYRSQMADIMSRRTSLQVKEAKTGESLKPGYIYIGRPNYHLLVNSYGRISLTQANLVNYVRPSADLLFESVATNYKNRAIAVVLSGTGHDGAIGVEAIKNRGGIVIAQNEETSEFFGMPKAAIKTGKVDYILPLSEIALVLVSLVMQNKEVVG